MSPRDRLLALLVAVCWGLNFPATALALEHFPPLFMVALRFALLAIPTILFIPRPPVPFRWLALIGLGIGILQFSFLYVGMEAGMPAGLASLVLQASAPFTVIIAGIWLRERVTRRQAIGIAVAVSALALIAVHRSQAAALLPVILTLCGALGWAIGNVAMRKAAAPNPLHLTLWVSVIPPVPLLALALVIEGPARIGTSLVTAFTLEALPAVLGLLYVVLIATVVGYGIWSSLLARYPSSIVAPFSMLVPVVGVFASWIVLGQVIDVVEALAGAGVVGGVLFASARAWHPGRVAGTAGRARNLPVREFATIVASTTAEATEVAKSCALGDGRDSRWRQGSTETAERTGRRDIRPAGQPLVLGEEGLGLGVQPSREGLREGRVLGEGGVGVEHG